MYRCPIMDSNEYIGEDDMYDWDMDYYPMQYIYPPNMYRMCPVILNNSSPCMNCMRQMDYNSQWPPQTYPSHSRSEESTGYYSPDDYDDMDDLEEVEPADLEPEDEVKYEDEEFEDNDKRKTKIRTVDISEIRD